MTAALRVLAAGPLSTLQDMGRVGWRRYGVAAAGALDPRGLAIANALVGNPIGAGAIEATALGDSYAVEAEDALMALAGDFALAIDGEPAAAWRSHRLRRGQTFAVGRARSTPRGYIAVAGGFAVAPCFGSVATHVRTGIGGFAGRALAAGDVLPLVVDRAPDRPALAFDPAPLAAPGPIRVALGPQDELFTARGLAAFFAGEYRASNEADRMGYRLVGPQIEHAGGYNIVSDGIPPGAVQVPGSQLPIVMLADCGTTGGYPKLGAVVAADLGRIAQCWPGESLRFARVSAEEARALHGEWTGWLTALPRALAPAGARPYPGSEELLRINLVGGVVDAQGET